MDKLITIQQAAASLGVSTKTLRVWDSNGKLPSVKTKGGHRRYRLSDIHSYIDPKADTLSKEVVNNNPDAVATYGRVSSHDQKKKGDLDRQCQRLSEYCAKKKYKVDYILKDVGSGLSDSRNGLNKLFDLVIERKINKVVIENKDRLTRYQFNVLSRFFSSYGIEIETVDNKVCTDEEELTNDIMMLMAVFSGKLYGHRSAKRRKELKQLKIDNKEKL